MEPCGLAISRIIGHAQGKTLNQDALIADPDIQTFTVKNNHDFILLGSANVFDMNNSLDDINTIMGDMEQVRNTHQYAGKCAEKLLEHSLHKNKS